MSVKSFVILYTKQTKKKHKVWHDGTLKFMSKNKGLLYDDKGSKLDSVFVKDDIQIGDQLESDHYLITIEEVLSSRVERTNDNADQVSTLPGKNTNLSMQSLHMQGRSNLKPTVAGNCLRQNRVGLKRQKNSGFVPPLLKTSMQVDNQKEISPFVSDKVREAHQNMNQTSYPNPNIWNSFVINQNTSNNVSPSLNSKNIRNNQTETYSSKSQSLENGNMDIGREAPVHSGIFQKIMSGMNESCIDESRSSNETQFKEKSRDLITNSKIKTSYESLYKENNMLNSTFEPEIQQDKSFPHFARKIVTVPFKKIQEAEEGCNTNFSEAMNGCGKSENISEVNPLFKGKNKRTASQVVALLKSNPSEIPKNKERESSAKKFPFSIDMSPSESRDPIPFKDHPNDTKNSYELEQEANSIDQESLEPNENVQFPDLAEKTGNELYSSQNAGKDSDVIKIKSQGDVSEEHFPNITISPNLDFDTNSDNSCGIDFISPDENIDRKNILFPIEGFKRSINMEESSELLVRNRDVKTFNKTISEKSLFVPTVLTSTVYHTQDKPQDEVSSDNITKSFLQTQKLQKNEEVAFSFLEFNNNSRDKNLVPNKLTLAEEHDPLLSNIDKKTDYKKVLEPKSNIKNALKNDLTFYESAISFPNNSPITKTEENGCSKVNTNSTIQVDRTFENFKDNHSKRPLVFPPTEQPQLKRIRIEPELNSAINGDEMFRIKNKRNNIKESLSPKVSFLVKNSGNVELPNEYLNQTENNPGVSENGFAAEVSENAFAEEVPENAFAEKMSKNVFAEEVSENVLVEEVSENMFAKEMSENVLAEEVPENILTEEVPENILAKEISKNVLAEEVSENVFDEKVFGLVQSEDNCLKSSISSSDHVLNNNFSQTKNNEGELTNMNVFDVPPVSNDKLSKFSFKSLSENKNKVSNCSHAQDNIIQENKSLNDIDLKINEPENTHTLPNTTSKSSLSDSVVIPKTGSSVACSDNSLSDDGLNFDLSFDFDDSSDQVNNKQIDAAQNAGSENLQIRNIKSVSYSLDPQNHDEEEAIIETEKKTKTVQIPKSVSADESSINPDRILTKQNISDSPHIKSSILDNVNPQHKEKNNHSNFSHSIPATRDVAKIVSLSSYSYLKTENEISDKNPLENKDQINITFDTSLSNQKETIQKSNEKESLSNNPCIKKNESVLDNPCKLLEDCLSESQSKHLDLSESKIISFNKICESNTANIDNGKNMNHEAHKCSITYSTLDELSFSPDPFDKFESGLDEILSQKEMIPSLDSRVSKSLDFANILDSSANNLEMSLISWDKPNTSSKTKVDEVNFSLMSHAEKVDTNLKFDSMESISVCTQNSVEQSEKTGVYRIGQIFPLTIDQNIPEERSQHLVKHQDFENQKRFIPQTRLRHTREICEDILPHPSRLKGNFGNSIPKMDPPKKSLLSRAADLNGYRMHGSVFSDMVKRTKESSNTKVNSFVFKEEEWNPETFHNSKGSFSPQEEINFSNIEERFGTDFNSKAKLIKRTEMDAYSSRKKSQGNDLYNAQNNAIYYDFDQIVPSHNDIMCSPNNESGITVPSFSNSFVYKQPISSCQSPSDLSPKEFENDFPESGNRYVSFPEFENKFPLSPYEAFSNFNFGLKKKNDIKNLGKSDFEHEHYAKIQKYSQLNFNFHWKDPEKTFDYREHSNQTESLSDSSDSQPSLTFNFDSSSENVDNNLHEINKIITSPNTELNKTLMKDIAINVPSKMSSNKIDSLEKFVNSTKLKDTEIQYNLVSNDEEYNLSDCQLISSSSESLKYEHKEIHTDKKTLSSKRKTEPVKCKPFEDGVTHENYNLCYYSPKLYPGENKESENIETNAETDFSDDQQLTLSEESIHLEKEVYNSLNLEREILINRNIQLRNEISNQMRKQNNENDWNSIKESHMITYSQQKIDSSQFVDAEQDDLIQFPENEILEITLSPYEKSTSHHDDDESKKTDNSFSQSFGLLPQLEDQFNESKRLRVQDKDDRQLYDKPDLILDQIQKEKKSTLFEDDISQNQKQLETFNRKCPLLRTENNNSVDLLTPNSYCSHSSSAKLKMTLHDFSPPLEKLLKSSLLIQPSFEIQSQSPSVTTTNSYASKLSKNQPEILSNFICPVNNLKVYNCKELKFPSQKDVAGNTIPKRRMVIPVTFQNVTEYKNILTSVLKEHLNIILFELSSNYHNSLTKADLSSYQNSEKNPSISSKYLQATGSGNKYPNCNCGLPSKMIQVRKEGKNKGRFFYTCTAAQSHRCKFFQWADNFDQQTPKTSSSPLTLLKSQSPKLYDGNSVNIYLRRHHIMFYCESVFVRQSPWEMKSKKYRKQYDCENLKDRLYIRLSFKDSSGCYSKDDLWVISKNLNFDPSVTFIARSVFYGPNSSSELQIEPMAGYFPSNWKTNTVCHAILAGNVSTELSCMMNLQDHVSISSSPIISSLLHRKHLTTQWTQMMPGFKTPFQCRQKLSKYSSHELASLAEKYVTFWKLNSGQAKALNNVASMLDSQQPDNLPIILIHGVFGSGKSFLLAIIVLYLLDVIETHEAMKSSADNIKDEKILITSTTNVAVDRILLYLLEFGCSEFIRVGSVRKIAKPILPFSVHATSNDNHDLKELQEMLKEENLSKMEKQYVRKSIEMHKLGLNKKKLCAVKVVGVTCASCSFSCLEKMKFPIVLLDECSQMTEPASLLPLARFGCEKLLLVGDPMQLDPTIQGSEAENEDGLEQSLFDRLLKMGHESVLLQRQYRCHPAISRIANTLFYGRQLENGIKDKDRPKLVPELPTLCFYDVSEGKEICESSGSFSNTQEADFVINIILALLASGVEPLSIGVIALYKSQTYEINRKMLESWQNPNNKFLKGKSIKSIQVSTVDAFQGGERDVIILSCVRTSHTGFVNNNKRMNVALTRARNHLFIVGKSSNLCTNDTWCKVIHIFQDSPNSFQSAKQAKIKLLDLCSHVHTNEDEEKNARTRIQE